MREKYRPFAIQPLTAHRSCGRISDLKLFTRSVSKQASGELSTIAYPPADHPYTVGAKKRPQAIHPLSQNKNTDHWLSTRWSPMNKADVGKNCRSRNGNHLPKWTYKTQTLTRYFMLLNKPWRSVSNVLDKKIGLYYKTLLREASTLLLATALLSCS